MFCKQKKKKSLKNVHSPYHQILSIKLCFVTYVIIRHVRLEPNYHYYVFLKHLNFKNKKERARVFFYFYATDNWYPSSNIFPFFLSFFFPRVGWIKPIKYRHRITTFDVIGTWIDDGSSKRSYMRKYRSANRSFPLKHIPCVYIRDGYVQSTPCHRPIAGTGSDYRLHPGTYVRLVRPLRVY